ncbi:MAG: hypothetical protein WA908_03560 [Pontixanthobacter sp.]
MRNIALTIAALSVASCSAGDDGSAPAVPTLDEERALGDAAEMVEAGRPGAKSSDTDKRQD